MRTLFGALPLGSPAGGTAPARRGRAETISPLCHPPRADHPGVVLSADTLRRAGVLRAVRRHAQQDPAAGPGPAHHDSAAPGAGHRATPGERAPHPHLPLSARNAEWSEVRCCSPEWRRQTAPCWRLLLRAIGREGHGHPLVCAVSGSSRHFSPIASIARNQGSRRRLWARVGAGGAGRLTSQRGATPARLRAHPEVLRDRGPLPTSRERASSSGGCLRCTAGRRRSD